MPGHYEHVGVHAEAVSRWIQICGTVEEWHVGRCSCWGWSSDVYRLPYDAGTLEGAVII